MKAVRAWRDQNEESGQVGSGDSEVKEDSSPYGAAVPKIESGELLSLLDPAEIRKRAMEAAGRFASLKGDLSLNHDEVLAEAFARTAHRDKTGNDQMPRRKD